ncbi:Erythroid transcription factor [Allomyces arbusculus]|nr:Erythroid transcription factor [Allomyces arbusculus]
MLPPVTPSPADAGLRRHAELFRRAPPPPTSNGSTDAHAPRPLAARQDSGHGGFALPAATPEFTTSTPAPFVNLGARARTASVSALGAAIGLPTAAPLGTPASHALPETPATVGTVWTMDDTTGFGAEAVPLPQPIPYERSRAPSYSASLSGGNRSAPRPPPGNAAAAEYVPALPSWTADPSQGAANRRSGALPLIDAALLESLLLALPPPPSSTSAATAAATAWLPLPPLDPVATSVETALAPPLPDPTLRPAWTLAAPAEPTELPDLETLLAHDPSLPWRSPTLAALNTRGVLSPQLPPGLPHVQGNALPPPLPLEPEVLAQSLPDIVAPASLHLHHHHHQPYSHTGPAAVLPPLSQQQIARESLASPTTASTATMLGAVLDWDDPRTAGSPSVSPGDDSVDNPWVNLFRQQSVDLDRGSSVAARATLPSIEDMEIDPVDVPRTLAGMWVGAPFSGRTSRRSSTASSEWASRDDSADGDASDLEALGVAGPYAPGEPWCDVPYPGRAIAAGGEEAPPSSSNSTSSLSSSASSTSSSPSDSPGATPATHTDSPTTVTAPIWPFAAHSTALDSPGAESVDSFLAHAATALPPAPGPATTWPVGPRIRLIVHPPPARAAAAAALASASPAPAPATAGIPLPPADDLDAFVLPEAPAAVPVPGPPRATSGKVRAPSPAESLSTVPTPRSSPPLEDDGEYDADGAEDEEDDEVSDEEAVGARARARQRNRNRNAAGGSGGGGGGARKAPEPTAAAAFSGVVQTKSKTPAVPTGTKTVTGTKSKSTPRRPPQPPPPPTAAPAAANKSKSKTKKKKKPRPPTTESENAHDDRPKQTSYLMQARDSMGRFGARRKGAHVVEMGPLSEPVENAQRRRHRPSADGDRAADRYRARELDARDGSVRVEPPAPPPPPAVPAPGQRSRVTTVMETVEPAAPATAVASKRSRTKSSVTTSARRSRAQSAATIPAITPRPRTAPATPAVPRARTLTSTATVADALSPASPKYVLDAGPGSAAQQLWSIFAVRRRQATADASAAVSLPSAPSEEAAEEAVQVPSPSPPPPPPPPPPRPVHGRREVEVESETQTQAVDLGPPSSDMTQQEEGEIVDTPAPPPKPAFLPYVARRAAASVADRRMQQQLAESPQQPPSAPNARARSPPAAAWKHTRRYERYEPAYATSPAAPRPASRELPAPGITTLVRPVSREFSSRSRSTSRGRGTRWPVSDIENDAPPQQRARTAPRRSGLHAGPIPLPRRPTAPPLAVPPGNGGGGPHNAGPVVAFSATRSYRPGTAAPPPPTPRSFDPARSYRPAEGVMDASAPCANMQRLPSRPKTPVVASVPSIAAETRAPSPPPAPPVAASSPPPPLQLHARSSPRVGPVVEVVPPSRVEIVPVPQSPTPPPLRVESAEPFEARGRARLRASSTFSPRPPATTPPPVVVAEQPGPLLTPPPPAPAPTRPSPLSPLSSVTGEEEAEVEAEDEEDGDEDNGDDDEEDDEEEGLASSIAASADAGSEYTDDASSCESIMSWAAPAFDEPVASRKARRRPSRTSTTSRASKRARTGTVSPTAAAATPDAGTDAAAGETDPPCSGLPPTKSRGRTKSGKPKLVGIPLATPVGAHAVVDDESVSPIPQTGDRVCFNCGNTATASWRRSRLHFRGVDDNGMPLAENLCNPCGLYEKLHGCDRPVERLETGEIRVVRGRRTQGVCTNCGATETPAWRRGMNHEPLCNACGLYRRTHNVHRPVLEGGGIDEDGTDGGHATETIELPDGGGESEEPAVVLRAASTSPVTRVRRATAAAVLDDRPRKRARFETAPARAVMPWTAVRRPPPLSTRRSGESVVGEQRMGAAGR